MAAGNMDSRLLEADIPKLVLDIDAITLGKEREFMTDSLLKKKEAEKVLRGLCGLLNSGGGVIKAQIKNQDYDLNRDGIGQDLENSILYMLPFVQQCLDFQQDGNDFLISVRSLSVCALPVATLATNFYVRNGATSTKMDAAYILELFKAMKDTGGRLHLGAELLDQRSGDDLQEEYPMEDSAAAFFNKTKLVYKEKFSLGESKNVEYKSFETEKLSQRIKESLRQYVSAFANTDGGYFFVGLRDNQEIIGFEAEESDLKQLESEIEKCIRQLPVYHFCEEKPKIKYSCRFIEVHGRPGGVRSYVCALRVERFCCAVFAKEPESWHVEDDCVKPFTMEEWVKHLMGGSED